MLALLAFLASPAGAEDPLATVRAFCRADGNGARLAAISWPAVAEMVEWQLEPAWDTIRLIAGYEVGTPKTSTGRVDVDVQYTVVAEVRSSGVKRERRIETRTYSLSPDGGGWRLRAPPSPPYVFESQADADALRALLDPDSSSYISAPALVSQLLRGADWVIPYADVDQLAAAPSFAPVRTAEVGDLALYYDGERPYHVGMVESEESIVSSTLNGGIRRTPFGAFAGEIKYRRPLSGATATPPSAPAPLAEEGREGGRDTPILRDPLPPS